MVFSKQELETNISQNGKEHSDVSEQLDGARNSFCIQFTNGTLQTTIPTV